MNHKYHIHSFIYFFAMILSFLVMTDCSPTKDELDKKVAEVSNPKTKNNTWIEDSPGILNNVSTINSLINDYEAKTGVEIAVVILPTIGEIVPKDFAVALFNYWGIGKKGKDNGILILHIMDQRRVEIEIGYGLEGDLPDVVVKRIIETYTIPAFKAEDFSKGHIQTVEALIAKLDNPKLAVEDLITDTKPKNAETEEEAVVETPKFERKDLYDYKGKAYVNLTEEEKQKLDSSIQQFSVTADYFLTDEENRLYSERTAEAEKQEKKESNELLLKVGGGYLSLWILFYVFRFLLLNLIPSPDFKYKIAHYTDIPIYYGALLIPVLIICLLSIYFFGSGSEPVLFVVPIVSYIIHSIFFGDRRLEKLEPKLLAIRKLPRKCKSCKQQMIKLSEEADNQYLAEGQIAEEIVKSIDYDVWICQSCNANQILPYPNINPTYIFKGTSFKKVKKCPECKFETFVCRSSKILSAATYSSSGKVEVNRICKNCKHSVREYETIPKKQKSSSGGSSGGGGGGGGSFGGGSSGGGGSGGSY